MSNIHVASFMKVGEKFVPVEHFQGPLKGGFYIEGALELMIDDVMISSVRYWDLIDQLWGYIIQGLEKLKAGERFETYWPDQPIKLVMVPLANGKVLVERSGTSDPNVKIAAEKGELIDALLAGASRFFDVYARFNSDWEKSDELRSLRELQNWRANPT